MLMLRMLMSTGNVFFAFALGLAACATLFIYDRPTMDALLGGAAGFKEWLVNAGLPTDYNVFVRLFLGEFTLVLMAFSMIARFAISIVTTTFQRLFGLDRR